MAIRLKKFLKNDMLFFRRTGSTGSGQPTYAAPVEKKCRWSNLREEVILEDGRRIMSNANVMIASPVEVGGLLMKGTLATWQSLPTYPKPPTVAQGGYEIMRTEDTPDIKCKDLLFMAWM